MLRNQILRQANIVLRGQAIIGASVAIKLLGRANVAVRISQQLAGGGLLLDSAPGTAADHAEAQANGATQHGGERALQATQLAGVPGRCVPVETELLAETLGHHADRGIERDTRAVGNATHALEVRDYAGDIDEGGRPHGLPESVARAGECRRIALKRRFGEPSQLFTVDDTAGGCLGSFGHCAEITFAPLVLDARPEHHRVGAGSVEALVERRDAPSDEFDLCAIDCAR